jgi:hypothetical protein
MQERFSVIAGIRLVSTLTPNSAAATNIYTSLSARVADTQLSLRNPSVPSLFPDTAHKKAKAPAAAAALARRNPSSCGR